MSELCERILLHLPDGPALTVPPTGAWIGRSPGCDVIVADPSVSRVHAQVRWVDGAAWAFGIGGRAVEVNGQRAERARLEPGDRLRVGDLDLRVSMARASGAPPRAWVLATDLYWLAARDGLTVGGGEADDVQVPGAGEAAVRLHVVRGGLVADVGAAALVDGEAVRAGERRSLRAGTRLRVGSLDLTVLRDAPGAASTTDLGDDALPLAAEFSFHSIGGALRLRYDDDWVEVPLSELRGRLVASLLDPPGDLHRGDWVPDDRLLGLVWPRNSEIGTGQLNQLLHRVRTALIEHGVDGYAVLERARRGGAIRFRLRGAP